MLLRNIFARAVPPMINTAETVAHRPAVAIVDVDPAVCSSLKFSLELEGFSVRAYYSGAELMTADDLSTYACFVVDQGLPDTDGIDLIESLRARDIAAPAILVVGHPRDLVPARAIERGIPLVEKPLIGNTLLGMIRKACGIA
jgi:two-component system, LuxR family, response regulator FixJ